MSDLLDRFKAALADRYAIDREVGRGGMAVVYLAEDLKHGRQVAIKVLQPSVSATLGTDRFLKEIETAARLQHPHILPLYDSGEADGFLYYVMPYVEGESLRDRLDREGQLPVEEAVRLAREVADGLGYAHAEGVVHRDIKPGNLMLQRGHAVIADFGIAQAVDEAGGERLTATGVSTGSPIYMSPEQARGTGGLDGRTDLYSLGCVLYEMLAGEAPFTGGTRASITARKEMEAAPDLRALRDTVPEGVAAAVHKALARVPADRFQTAEELGAALKADAHGVRPPAGRKVSRLFSENPGLRWAVIAGLAIALAAVAWRLWPPGGTDSPRSVASDARLGVAVFPFDTRGEGMEYWREGIVNLLSYSLDGVEGLQKTDPSAVLAAWDRTASAGRAGGQNSVLSVARDLGASYAVTGAVVQLGSEAQLVAEVYDVGGGESRGSVRVSGSPDSPTELVDALTLELLRENLLPSDPEHQPLNLSRTTTMSLPALKAYLAGEEEYRLGRYSSAARGYQEALELDSTFARAAFKLSLAYGWEGNELASEAATRAAELADRLPERDATLLRAVGAGFSPEAIAGLEELTRRYPDDVEAWQQLGDTYFHSGARAIRPIGDYRRVLRTAMDLNPFQAEAYQHLIEDAFLRQDSARARELIDDYTAGGFDQSREWNVSYDLVWGDETALRTALVTLDSVGAEGRITHLVQAPMAAPIFTLGRLAEAYLSEVETAVDLGHRVIALFRFLQVPIPRGQAELAGTALERFESDSDLAPLVARWQAQMYVSGLGDSATAQRAATVLADHGQPTDRFWLTALALADEDLAAARDYVAMLEAQSAELLAVDRTLDAGYATAYADALDAFVSLLGGEWEELDAFEEALGRFPPASYIREQPHQYMRYRVGSMLYDEGRLADAERYFQSFQPYDYFYTSLADLYMGRIFEAKGDTEEAIKRYERFVVWYEPADTELKTPWEEAVEALERLKAGA